MTSIVGVSKSLVTTKILGISTARVLIGNDIIKNMNMLYMYRTVGNFTEMHPEFSEEMFAVSFFHGTNA